MFMIFSLAGPGTSWPGLALADQAYTFHIFSGSELPICCWTDICSGNRKMESSHKNCSESFDVSWNEAKNVRLLHNICDDRFL